MNSAEVAMRPGVRVAVDVGAVRVGVAASDPGGLIATPLAVLPRQTSVAELAGLVRERAPIEVLVGLPRGLSGLEGPAAAAARDYAAALAEAVAPTPVRLVDERLSTVEAGRALRAAGRSTRQARGIIDAAAAVVILQSALDTERATGVPPGELHQ